MKTLAFDTSFDACSAAIIADGETLWSRTDLIGRGHSEALPLMVREALVDTGLVIKDIDRIGVVIGPGAFAGVRVGLAFARGLCIGTHLRAIGVTSLEALAASAKTDGPIAPVFDARRGQVYAALYDRARNEVLAPFVAAPAIAASRLEAADDHLLLAGSGAALVAAFDASARRVDGDLRINPVAVAALAATRPLSGGPPAPLYLRPPDAAPPRASAFAGVLRP